MNSNLQVSREKPPASLRWWKRIAFSLIPTLAFWVVLEAALAVVGVEPETRRGDPFVGFAGLESLFVEQESQPGQPVRMTTRGTKLEWFNPQSFDKRKPEGTHRIFCLGGSTTYGRPYADDSSFAGWLREMLQQLDGNSADPAEWEVINAGGVSYASYRVASIMEELVEYEPDLVVIYSAHNEFLERRTYQAMFRRPSWLRRIQGVLARTRTYAVIQKLRQASAGQGASQLVSSDSQSALGHAGDALASPGSGNPSQSRPGAANPPAVELLPREVDERLNHTIGPTDYARDDAWSRRVVRHYEMNLMRMIRMAKQVGAEVILVAPAVNARDLSPFKSQFSDSTPELVQQEIADMLQQARVAADAGKLDAAVQLASEAVERDPRFADAQYALGQLLFESEQYAASQVALQRAIDEDVCPLRATTAIDKAVARVAKRAGVMCVDFGAELKQLCLQEHGHDVLGREYFLDHVHPTIEANGTLAARVLQAMVELDLVQADEDQILAATGVANDAITGRISLEVMGVALRNLAKVLHWSGKFAEALPRADDAIELLGSDPESRLIMADCLNQLGFTDRAIAQYEILFADTPGYELAFLPYGTLLYDLARYDEARYYLLMAGVVAPENVHVLWRLSQVHIALGETQEAAEVLRAAKALSPHDPRLDSALRELQQP